MGEPITTAALVSRAAGPILGGIGNRQQAKADQEAARVNSFIARTRANQADTDARMGLNDEFANMRAVLGANGQDSSVGTFELFRDLRTRHERARRIGTANANQEASDFDAAGRNAGRRARMAIPMGVAAAGPSLFDLYQKVR